ncbi:hypothetical protein MKW98_019003 [Papaver atlanticum]|uniref:PGG domain-containing protein n=1 Tax=Papaver atlanticum TaxID=357466 RepID=A0AAD4XYW1_9MAGN|nr:hypothetical protein MKW98_019003 [Papaver atlanticum]
MSRKLNVYCQIMFSDEDSCLKSLDEISTSFCRTPLHISAMCSDITFAAKILGKRCDLALKTDSQGFTPLHLASTRTSHRMVKLLVEVNSDACMYQDQYGRTPLYLAAMNDQIRIMEVLLGNRPEAIHLRHDRDENILHFCVKHNKLKSLKFLVEFLVGAQPANRNDISVNSKDNGGNTILHLAAEMKKFKILNYLLECKTLRIEINAVNNKNVKALDMLSQTERDDLEFGFYDYLGRAKKLKKEALSRDNDGEWMKERVNALLVVATLIAGIAFQAVINPPGGVWQDDTKVDSGTDPIRFAYYIYHMFGTSGYSMSGYWDSYLQNHQRISALSKNISIGGSNGYFGNSSAVSPDDTQDNIYDFIESLELLYNNHSKNILGGSVFPYLMRYAGYPVMAYTYPFPFPYSIYMVTITIAFLVSATVILLVMCGFTNDTSPAQVRLLAVMMSISNGCITFGYLIISLAVVPEYFIVDLGIYSIYGYVGLWGICGISLFIWKLVSNIVKIEKRHLVGVHQYFKMLFHVRAKDASRLILFSCCICVFFVMLALTYYYDLLYI